MEVAVHHSVHEEGIGPEDRLEHRKARAGPVCFPVAVACRRLAGWGLEGTVVLRRKEMVVRSQAAERRLETRLVVPR